MNTLDAEMEIKKAVQATETVEMVDCGRVSERTQGTSWLILFELGAPPLDKLLFF
jgi:hypothetical protein